MKFIITPNTFDGSTVPIRPDPVPAVKVGKAITDWLDGYRRQGYYRNCRQIPVALQDIEFVLTQVP